MSENFSDYMREKLYGPQGFYTKGGGAGRDRDYITSPEVGDLFGFVIASYIDDWYDSLETDGTAIVIDAGSGPGSLAASIARASMCNAENIDYRLMDISPVHQATSTEKLRNLSPNFTWSTHGSIPICDVPTLVIANELLDNLVFDIGRTTDVYQRYDPDRMKVGEWAARYGIFGNIDRLSGADVSIDISDFRIPLHVGIAEWMEELREATNNVTDLTVLFFDYMKSVTNMADEKWLRLYADNKRAVGVDEVLAALEAGATGDITTDVTLEDLHLILDHEGFSKISVQSQSQWLSDRGIDLFISNTASASPYDEIEKFVQGQPDTARGSSFVKERDILTDENGLGAFSVVSARRQI